MNIRASWEPRHQRLCLYVTDEVNGNWLYAEPVVMTPAKERFEYREPCMIVDDKKELQNLFDDLWFMGLRPSVRSDEYKAQLNTMRNHLNDMRTLVFKKREDLT